MHKYKGDDFVFYERFVNLCNERGVKPTPLLKSLKLSPGNLERWRNGATVNSDILVQIAKYFNVSTDYLLGLKDR